MKIKNLIKTFTILSVICGLQISEGFAVHDINEYLEILPDKKFEAINNRILKADVSLTTQGTSSTTVKREYIFEYRNYKNLNEFLDNKFIELRQQKDSNFNIECANVLHCYKDNNKKLFINTNDKSKTLKVFIRKLTKPILESYKKNNMKAKKISNNYIK